MSAAATEPLPFAITLTCGEYLISGRVAPSSWWYEINKTAARAEMDEQLNHHRRRKEPRVNLDDWFQPLSAVLDQARAIENQELDEVTLVDVQVFPAVGGQGSRSDGLSLPVARVPLGSISAWWVLQGQPILRGPGPGGAGAGMSSGFLFPIGGS